MVQKQVIDSARALANAGDYVTQVELEVFTYVSKGKEVPVELRKRLDGAAQEYLEKKKELLRLLILQ